LGTTVGSSAQTQRDAAGSAPIISRVQADPRLVERLVDTGECDWVEWKHSWFDPRGIGRYASALANGARLTGRSAGYLAWGIANDGTVVGTTSTPAVERVDEQPFEFWLKGRIGPKGHAVRFHDLEHEGHKLVILEVDAAQVVPVRFEGIAYIRVGSATPRLEDHPDREKRLLEALVEMSFEGEWAREDVTVVEAHDLLDVAGALRLLQQSPAATPSEQLEQLRKLRLVESTGGGRFWAITNRAAVLFAKRLEDFGDRIQRRAARVIFYEGDTRVRTHFEHPARSRSLPRALVSVPAPSYDLSA
jgi:ATP-dependent DNA helicase RecG